MNSYKHAKKKKKTLNPKLSQIPESHMFLCLDRQAFPHKIAIGNCNQNLLRIQSRHFSLNLPVDMYQKLHVGETIGSLVFYHIREEQHS